MDSSMLVWSRDGRQKKTSSPSPWAPNERTFVSACDSRYETNCWLVFAAVFLFRVEGRLMDRQCFFRELIFERRLVFFFFCTDVGFFLDTFSKLESLVIIFLLGFRMDIIIVWVSTYSLVWNTKFTRHGSKLKRKTWIHDQIVQLSTYTHSKQTKGIITGHFLIKTPPESSSDYFFRTRLSRIHACGIVMLFQVKKKVKNRYVHSLKAVPRWNVFVRIAIFYVLRSGTDAESILVGGGAPLGVLDYFTGLGRCCQQNPARKKIPNILYFNFYNCCFLSILMEW